MIKIIQKKEKRKSPGAFTLTEVLIYIATLVIILLALSSFIIWSMHSVNKLKTMREVLYNARRPIEIMTHEIREAKSISPASTEAHLSLEKSDGSYTDFYLASSTLYQQTGSEAEMALTSNKVEVKNLEFELVGNDTSTSSVMISFRVDYKNPADLAEYRSSINATSSASLRIY
jgi:type II secretory pathway pseudopilin PulG